MKKERLYLTGLLLLMKRDLVSSSRVIWVNLGVVISLLTLGILRNYI